MRAENDAGQSHAAQRCPEGIGIFGSRAGENRPIGNQQLELLDEIGNRSIAMMIFSMHIRGNRAANGDKFGAGRYGRKVAAWQQDLQQVFK